MSFLPFLMQKEEQVGLQPSKGLPAGAGHAKQRFFEFCPQEGVTLALLLLWATAQIDAASLIPGSLSHPCSVRSYKPSNPPSPLSSSIKGWINPLGVVGLGFFQASSCYILNNIYLPRALMSAQSWHHLDAERQPTLLILCCTLGYKDNTPQN